jgi:hypothetical protein
MVEKTADLPVQQATKVELNINLKIGKALGLTMLLSFIGRAYEVIEQTRTVRLWPKADIRSCTANVRFRG